MEVNMLQQALLCILDKFIEVCKSHGLRYYLAYGSVLGAVRHKGIIPWDDDIDVQMPREDYEKIQLLPKDVWGDMQLTSWKLTPINQYHFLKLENTKTTVIEQLYPLYIGGIYLDIFPLDETPKDEDIYRSQLEAIHKIEDKYYTITIRCGNNYKGIVNYMKFEWRHHKYLKQHIQDEWESIATHNYEKSGKVIDYHQPDVWKCKPMPYSWFGRGREVDFEGRKVVIPENYDAYLTHIYGDYMTPPPEDKRGGHAFVYVNLRERIGGDTANKVIKDIRRKHRFVWKLKDEINYWRIKLKI